MVNFDPHYKFSFGGTTIDEGGQVGNEIWNCNVNFVSTSASGDVGGTTLDIDEEAYLGEVAPHLLAWFVAPNSGMSNTSTLDFLKVNKINAAGHYASQTVHTHAFGAGGVGDSRSGGKQPVGSPITSSAYTWDTALRTGAGAHGRIYPPNFTYGQPGSFALTATERGTAVAAAKALLGVVGNIGATTVRPVVASGTNGTNIIIKGARVGNVIDVQRRRKDAYREVYTRLSYP